MVTVGQVSEAGNLKYDIKAYFDKLAEIGAN